MKRNSDSCSESASDDEVVDTSLSPKKLKMLSAQSLHLPLSPKMKNEGRRRRKGSSKYRGVCWLKERKAWRARIEVGGKREHLGYFNTEEEAAHAYDQRARMFRGSITRLNFPDSVSLQQDNSKEIDGNSLLKPEPIAADDMLKATEGNLLFSPLNMAQIDQSLLNAYALYCNQALLLNQYNLYAPLHQSFNRSSQEPILMPQTYLFPNSKIFPIGAASIAMGSDESLTKI